MKTIEEQVEVKKDGQDTWEIRYGDFVKGGIFLHDLPKFLNDVLIQALQDRDRIAKAEWLREEIKKLKVSEVKNGTIQKWYGREEFITEDEADGFNAAIATIIDRHQKELDEITSK